MRTCSRCKQTKDESAFNLKVKGYLQSACRECQSAYHKEYYENNKARYLEKARKRNAASRAALRAYVDAVKDVPCTDCGIKYPPYVMQLDHREGTTKFANVGDMARSDRYSMAALKAEIEKCEVVCANCHAIRTHERLERAKRERRERGENVIYDE